MSQDHQHALGALERGSGQQHKDLKDAWEKCNVLEAQYSQERKELLQQLEDANGELEQAQFKQLEQLSASVQPMRCAQCSQVMPDPVLRDSFALDASAETKWVSDSHLVGQKPKAGSDTTATADSSAWFRSRKPEVGSSAESSISAAQQLDDSNLDLADKLPRHVTKLLSATASTATICALNHTSLTVCHR